MFHLSLMHLESLIMCVEALPVSLMPSLEFLELGFNDWIDVATPINRTYVLWPPGDFPARLLDVARSSVELGKGDDRIHLLCSWSWGRWWFFMLKWRSWCFHWDDQD